MRIPKPHWKASHKCYYVKLGGTFHRLDPEEDTALNLYADLLRKYNRPEAVVPSRLTGRSLCLMFLDWAEANNAADTVVWYKQYLLGTGGTAGRHKNGGFANWLPANLLASGVKQHHLDAWMRVRYPSVSDTTRANAMTAVARVFNWAAKKGYLESSPMAKVEKPQRDTRGEQAALSNDQWRKVMAAVAGWDGSFRDYLLALRHTGCRPQEIRKVEARHLDRKNKRWEFPVKESKGKKSKRLVTLGPEVFEICERLAKDNPTGPLFRNADGGPWTRYSLANRFNALSRKVKFPICAYAVRHTFATEAVKRGVDVITLSSLMGHKDLKMLREVYAAHITDDSGHMEAARKKAIGLL